MWFGVVDLYVVWGCGFVGGGCVGALPRAVFDLPEVTA